MHDRPPPRAVVVLFVGLVSVSLVGAGFTGPVGPAAATITPPSEHPDAEGTLRLEQHVALTPEHPGEVDVTLRYQVPSNVAGVTVTLPSRASVQKTAGFDRSEDRTYEWDGRTDAPTITLQYAANETGRRLGPYADDGSLTFVDTGSWALVRRVPTAVEYRYRGSLSVDRTLAIDGEGVAGEAIAYLGPHNTTTRTAHGQTFRLVRPRAADLHVSPDTIFDSVTAAAATIDVGHRDRVVTMVAAPATVPWGVRGLQLGAADFYVVANERVDSPANTWLHEYVHTRQNLSLGPDTRWIVEGMATYLAAQQTLVQERIEYDRYRTFLDRGANGELGSVVLADPTTWRGGAQYWKGALVAAAIDREVRLATDREATLNDVWRALNSRAGPVDQSALLDEIAHHSTEAVADTARRYTTGRDPPATWNRSEQSAAFGSLPARVHVDLPARTNQTAWRVAGQFRSGTLAGTDALTLVPGETLTVDVPVRNTGSRAGRYDLTVMLDGRPVANRSGVVGPDETVREPISISPETPGRYALDVGGPATTVAVVPPAQLAVTAVDTNRTVVTPGTRVRLRATVRNEATRPGEATVPVAVDGTERTRRTVRLPPSGTTAVSATVRLTEGGTHRLTVGHRSVSIRVEATSSNSPTEPATTAQQSGRETTGGAGPGIAIGTTLLALVLAGWARRH